MLAGKLRRGRLAPLLVLLFSGAVAQKKINVMQRLCLEDFRQMPAFSKSISAVLMSAIIMAL
jgi:hypothetical protein